MTANYILAGEFLASLFFVVALSQLKKVKTSKSSILYGVVGIIIAVGSTLIRETVDAYVDLSIVLALGCVVGIVIGRLISFQNLPQMVAVYNSFGGVSAALAAVSSYINSDIEDEAFDKTITIFTIALGSLTFSGSLIAAAKLQQWVQNTWSAIVSRTINIILLSGLLVFAVLFFVNDPQEVDGLGLYSMIAIAGISFLMGIPSAMAVGGADAPVLISVLNSLSGWSGAAAGLLTGYNSLVIVGILVGSSGFILSIAMAQAMNRPLSAVILGGKMKKAAGHSYDQADVKIGSEEDVVSTLVDSKKVLIVPGFGLAQSRAGGNVAEITKDLQQRGITVHFCVHPVAGRMPGHLAVILAENAIPYDIIFDLQDLEGQFDSYDCAIAIGCADTINPVAMEVADSNIAGMPIVPTHFCKKTFVLKRSPRLDSGYSGEPLSLLLKDNCSTVLGDAKKTLTGIQSKLQAIPKENVADNNELSINVVVQEEEPLPELSPDHVTIGVMAEIQEGEHRVAIHPDAAKRLRKMGFRVMLASGAGDGAKFSDDLYIESGAEILPDNEAVVSQADVVVKINPPSVDEVAYFRPGQHLISLVMAKLNAESVSAMKEKKLTVTALEQIPRISRAQKMDVLSSQAKAAGYRAVIEGTSVIGRFLNTEVTASGKFPPCKAFVLGAGVAGLASIGLLTSLGAETYAFDSRPIGDEVESLGGKWVQPKVNIDASTASGYAKELGDAEKQAQREMNMDMCKKCDLLILTAASPFGAPKLIFDDMIAAMKPGSCIVDLAALGGGNTTMTKIGDVVEVGDNRVTIIGYTNLPSRMATQSSQMFGQNMVNLFDEFSGGKGLKTEFFSQAAYDSNVVVKNSTFMKDGEELTHPPIQVSKKPAAPVSNPTISEPEPKKEMSSGAKFVLMIVLAVVVFAVAYVSPKDFVLLEMLLVLVLASLVGWFIIWAVDTRLHSPLMSLTNAISGIVVLSTMSLVGSANLGANILALIAAFLAVINIAGGFQISSEMFKKICQ
ncbi:hypothetical protein P9112_002137 [Eukaryota sp. TZLM1-RC]